MRRGGARRWEAAHYTGSLGTTIAVGRYLTTDGACPSGFDMTRKVLGKCLEQLPYHERIAAGICALVRALVEAWQAGQAGK